MKDRRKYGNDVFYRVWHEGGNPDIIDLDRVEYDFYEGVEAGEAANREIQRQQNKRLNVRPTLPAPILKEWENPPDKEKKKAEEK